MQALTQTLKEAIRGSYQVPLAKIEIINADGSSAGEILDVIDVSMGNFSSRNIKRSIKLSLDNSGGQYTPHPDLYDRNLLWYNKKMKLFFGYKTTTGSEWLPQGVFNINGIDPSVGTDGITLELEGQDILEALVEDQFDDIYKIEVTATESVNYALPENGGSATASSSITVGDEIQYQAAVHYADAFAVINGLRKEVINESGTDSKNMINKNNDPEFIQKWDSQPYAAIHTTVNSTAGGVLNLTSTGNDPSFNMPSIGSFDPNIFRWIEFRYRILSGPVTGAEFFFTNDRYTGANAGQQVNTPALIADGQWQIRRVDMWSHPDWKNFGNIRGWRYDWATASGVNMELDYISLKKDVDQLSDFISKYTPGQGETVTELENEIFLDLKDQLQLQQININFTDGGELTDFLFTSPDNATWTSFTSATVTPSGPVRFIKFKVRKRTANADGSWSLGISEIQIKTASSFLPAAAIDGDVYDTDWRPSPTDPDPWIQIDLGQARTFNAIYTYWGNNSFDFWNRVKYFIETSANGSSWSRVSDLNSYDENNSFYGEVEHCILSRNARYIRINIKGRDGVAIFRHIKVANINASKSIRDNMIDVLETTSITQYEIPYTRRYIERKMAEIGDEKEAFLQSLAVSANWQQGTDENGVYKAAYRDINPVDYAWDFTTDDDNIFEFNVFLSNDIKNVIVVTCEASDKKAIVGRASDTNPLSPTSIQNLGRRVQTYKGESYNTQAICDRKAQEQLFERTRSKHHTSIPTTGHPAIQVDDVVRVTVDEAKIIQAFFLVTGYESSYKADTAEFDTRINISLLV